MSAPLQPMSLREYADFQTRLGATIRERDGCYWRRVRPLLYRPLLATEPYAPTGGARPLSWPIAYQHVTTEAARANSTMNFVMLRQPQKYALERLTHKRRQLIRRAGDFFQVRRLADPRELKGQGHRVYLSFYERTHYPYRSDRRDPAVFDAWVDSLFASPKTIVMGGFGAQGLGAICSAYWVERTLVYSTLMCETESLRRNLAELVFHHLQALAATEPGIGQILVRNYQGGNSLDQYYLMRGCELVRLPARIEMPAIIRGALRVALPHKYELLVGED